jgi:hypothetical protein
MLRRLTNSLSHKLFSRKSISYFWRPCKVYRHESRINSPQQVSVSTPNSKFHRIPSSVFWRRRMDKTMGKAHTNVNRNTPLPSAPPGSVQAAQSNRMSLMCTINTDRTQQDALRHSCLASSRTEFLYCNLSARERAPTEANWYRSSISYKQQDRPMCWNLIPSHTHEHCFTSILLKCKWTSHPILPSHSQYLLPSISDVFTEEVGS